MDDDEAIIRDAVASFDAATLGLAKAAAEADEAVNRLAAVPDPMLACMGALLGAIERHDRQVALVLATYRRLCRAIVAEARRRGVQLRR